MGDGNTIAHQSVVSGAAVLCSDNPGMPGSSVGPRLSQSTVCVGGMEVNGD